MYEVRSNVFFSFIFVCFIYFLCDCCVSCIFFLYHLNRLVSMGGFQAASNYHVACRKHRQQKLAEEAAAADEQPRTIQGVRKEREKGR